MAKVSIIGAGSWGIAISLLLNNNGHEVTVWSVLKDEIKMLNEKREHTKSLPGVKIPESIVFSDNLEAVLADPDIVVLAVASPYTRSTAHMMSPHVKEGQIIVNVGKGPSHAEEVGRGIPTTCVVGTRKKANAEFIQNVFMSNVFRVYTSPDMLGICLGGSLKNVIALAAGMADGLGYGDNTKAALITRGMAEITRLGVKMGGKPQTFSGLSGIGDLIVTCESMHSRNRRAGILIGKGYTADEAMKEVQMVVEGVYSARAALKLAKKYDVSMPIVEQVNHILFDDKKAADAVMELMLRDKTIENSELPWEE